MNFKTSNIKTALILILAIMMVNIGYSATITSNQSGDWSDVNSWVGGVVPQAGDDVVINHTIDLNVNSATITNLDIQAAGTLRPDFPGNYDLNVDGNITVAGSLNGIAGIGGFLDIYLWGSTNFNVTGSFSTSIFQVSSLATVTLTSNVRCSSSLEDFDIYGSLDADVYELNFAAGGTFDLLSGATLSTNVAGGVDATILGSATETYDAGANYIFSTNVTAMGMGSIPVVNDIEMIKAVITSTNSIEIQGRIFANSGASNSSRIEGLGQGTTFTLSGTTGFTPTTRLNIFMDFINVTGTIPSFPYTIIGVGLDVQVGASLQVSGGRILELRPNAALNIDGSLTCWGTNALGNNTIDGSVTYGYIIGSLNSIVCTNGTINFNAPTSAGDKGIGTFDNLQIGGTTSFHGTLTVNNNLIITGNWSPPAGSVTMQGGNISGGGTASLNDLILNGLVTQVGTDVTINGDINVGTSTLDVGTNSLELQGDIISTTGNIDLNNNASTFILSGSTAISIGAGELAGNRAGNLVLNRGNTVTINNTLNVDSDLTMNNASLDFNLNGNLFLLFNDFNYSAGTILSSGQFLLLGTGNMNLPDCFENRTMPNFTFLRNGTVTIPYDFTVTSFFEINQAACIVDIEDNSLTVGNNFIIPDGELDLTDDNSTIVLTGGTAFPNDGFTNGEIGNLIIQRNSTTTLNADLTIDGTLTMDNAGAVFDIDTHNLTVGGGITYNSGVLDATDDTSTLTFVGTTAVNLDAAALQNDEVGNITLNQTSGQITLNDNLTVDGTFTIGAGFFRKMHIGTNTLTLNGPLVRAGGAGVIYVLAGTVVIGGTGNITIPTFFFETDQVNNLTITKNGVITQAVTDLFVGGAFTLNNVGADYNIETNDVELNLRNTINYTNGVISAQTGGTLSFNSTNAVTLPAAMIDGNTINEIIIWDAKSVTLGGNLTIPEDLELRNANSVLDIQGNQLTIEGVISNQTGEIDATDDASVISLEGSSAITLTDLFVNDEVGSLTVLRTGGQTTYSGDLSVDGTLTISNGGQIFDIDGSTLTLNGLLNVAAGTIDLDDASESLVISAASSVAALDATDFENSTLNELFFLRGVAVSNDLTIVNNLEIENGLGNFGNNLIDIQGDITLDNGGSISSGITGTFEFSNLTNFTNNSNGTIFLTDVDVTGTLNSTVDKNISGDLNVSGVYNHSAGVTNFLNSALRTITNTGTCDFNDVTIDNDSDITTASSFDINGDLTLNNVNASFAATTPSNITLTTNNSQITTAADANVAGTTGLSFYNLTLGASQNFFQNGAHIVYVNGDFIADNGRLNMDTGSELRFTDPAGATTFGYLNCDHLTFESTADFNSFDIVIGCDGNITVDAGGNVILNSFVNMNDTDNTLINDAPNDYTNLRIARLVVNGTTTTDDDFSLRNSFLVNASGDFTQTAGTINFDALNPTLTNNATQVDCVFFNVRVTSDVTSTADFIVDDDFTVVAGGDSFIASAGEVLFRKANLALANNGTLTFYDVEFAGTVTNGSTSDDFTVANDLTMNTNSNFVASTPSLLTFSGGNITTANSADGSTIGLNIHDVEITGAVATVGSHIIDVSGDFTVTSGGFTGDNSSTINISGVSGNITNNASLDFETLVISTNATGTYTTATSFDVNEDLEIEAGGFLNATAGEIRFEGTANNIISSNSAANNLTFYDIEIDSENAISSSSFSVLNDYTVTTNSVMNHNGGETHFVGGMNHTLNNNGDLQFWDLLIENSTNNLLQTTSDFEIAGTKLIIEGSSSSFNANDGLIEFSNSSGTITNNGQAGNLIFHDITFVDASFIELQENDHFNIQGDFTNAQSGNFRSTGSSIISFNGSSKQTITGNGGSATFQNFTLNNSSGLELDGDIELNKLNVAKELTLTDGDIDLNGDNILTMLKPDAFLYENGGNFENTASGISPRGHIYYEYDFTSKLSNINVLGLGIGFRQGSPSNIFGTTIIKRYHTNLQPVGSDAIKRFYSVESTNDDLNTIVTIEYLDSELSNSIEDNLILLSNRTPSDSWAARETSVFPNLNRIQHSDSVFKFDDFETIWTASEPILLDLIENQDEEVDTTSIPNGRLIAGESDYMILGFSIFANGSTDIEQIKFYINGNNRGQLENFKLYQSDDNVFVTQDDNTLVGDSALVALDSIEFDENLPLSSNQTLYFFLTADVNDTVSVYSPSSEIYINQAGIRSSTGIVNIKEIFGQSYLFQQRLDLEFNPIGLAQPPFYPNMKNLPIYGFEINTLGNEGSLKGFDLVLGEDVDDAFSGNLRLIRSTDNNYLSQEDNNEMSLLRDVVINENSIYSIDLVTEQIIDTLGKYYFLVADSISINAAEGTKFITPRVPIQSLRASEAAPVLTDTAFGLTYDFKDLEVSINNYSSLASKTLTAGIRDQVIYSFELQPDDNAIFTSLTTILELGSADENDFINFKLFRDLNENNVPESNELLKFGDLNGNELDFVEYLITQNITQSSKYLITCSPKNNISSDATIKISIPDESYIIFESPAYLVAGGPFSGNTHYFTKSGLPAKLKIESIVPSTIIDSDQISVTIKTVDSNGQLALNTINENINFTFNGTPTITGQQDRVFNSGEAIKTFSGFNVNINSDYEEFTVSISSDNYATIQSEILPVYKLEPSNAPGNLILSDGSPSSSRIRLENWSKGSGDGRIIVARVGNTPKSPIDGINYEPITSFSNVGAIGLNQTAPGSVVIYDGDINSNFEISELISGQTYYFRMFEYNISNGRYNYFIPPDLQTFQYTTADIGEQFSGNIDTTTAAAIPEDFVIEGRLTTEIEEDWFKYFVDSENILIELCGDNRVFELYYQENDGSLSLIRVDENIGESCGVVILNNAERGTYFVKVYGTELGRPPISYSFKITPLESEIFSRENCECP